MIRVYPDPALRKPSRRAAPGEPETLAAIAALREAFDPDAALGLAANQIGHNVRVAIVRLGEETRIILNPEVVERSPDLEVDTEGCLSLPGVEAEVPRPRKVIVRAQDEDGKEIRLELEGLEARLLLHEIDHLDGILFIDHLPADERREVLRRYKEVRESSARASSSPERESSRSPL
ncbi:peptide deformylase [Candidatus Bipolaricaulota sp. J31]